eukprot:jgi/Botrbrau1/20310/Bobra.0526s0001.1
MAEVGAAAQGTPPRNSPGPQYHTITNDMFNVLLQQAPQKLVPFSMAAPNSTAGRYSLFSIAPSGRTLIVTENLPGFQCEFEDDEGVPLVELLALDKEGVLVTRQFSHETVMFGSIFRNQHSLLKPDVVEFLNHKELEKFLPRLVSLQEVKVFRNYGTGNVPVGLPTWGARVPPTASGGPSGIGPPPKPLAMEMVDLSKHSSGGRGQREGSPEVTSPAPLSSKGACDMNLKDFKRAYKLAEAQANATGDAKAALRCNRMLNRIQECRSTNERLAGKKLCNERKITLSLSLKKGCCTTYIQFMLIKV